MNVMKLMKGNEYSETIEGSMNRRVPTIRESNWEWSDIAKRNEFNSFQWNAQLNQWIEWNWFNGISWMIEWMLHACRLPPSSLIQWISLNFSEMNWIELRQGKAGSTRMNETLINRMNMRLSKESETVSAAWIHSHFIHYMKWMMKAIWRKQTKWSDLTKRQMECNWK